ncbi:hypothetical protein ACFL0T_08460, partial [Candidatus Omnitrophota bacterium]
MGIGGVIRKNLSSKLLIFTIILSIISSAPVSYALRPTASKASSSGANLFVQNATFGAGSWIDDHVPNVSNSTLVSAQAEAGLDRALIEALLKLFGPEMTRYASQVSMTGGLGALMHDLICAYKKNGYDVVGIHPVYESIKGMEFGGVVYRDEETGELVQGLPELPEGCKTLGDMIRKALGEPVFRLPTLVLNDEEFAANANDEMCREIMGREIRTDVYRLYTKYGEAPQYYVDSYYLDNYGNQVHIFDSVYPDSDRRW